MAAPLLLPLTDCTDPTLVGGKAAGLARLLRAGFPVPAGICLTTEAYHQILRRTGLLATEQWSRIQAAEVSERDRRLADARSMILKADPSSLVAQALEALRVSERATGMHWAVRSSATNEDAAHASFAGLYRTKLGVTSDQLGSAILDLWASLWDRRVVDYGRRAGVQETVPAMAVVIQPMLAAQTAGVAYSIHPLTGRANQVTVDAIHGLGVPLVDGLVTPDQFVVETDQHGEPVRVRRRSYGHQTEQMRTDRSGIRTVALDEAGRTGPALTDERVFAVARAVKQVEQRLGHPVDCEWVYDETQLWLVQARPITAVQPTRELTNDDCEWSRTNFKETMPEIPSPLGLSFLHYFMDTYILSHYRRLGCHIPPGLSSVRVLEGRPYLNVTLFHSLVGQLGGDPSMNVEQMGGEPLQTVPPVKRIGWLAYLRAGWLIWGEMRRCEREGPAWFAEMKRLTERFCPERVRTLSFSELAGYIEAMGRLPDGREVTFGIAGAVGQCLQVFSRLLPRWLGPDWRALLNAALQGQGTVISAQQILRLAELAQVARRDQTVMNWLRSDPWEPRTLRDQLAGTDFLRVFDRYLNDYGHRAIGESDIASPRLSEQPESVLTVLRAQVRAAEPADPSEIEARQTRERKAALAEIERRLGWRRDRRLIFRWWYRRLATFFSLREANRHHLMYYSTAARNLLLRAGELLTEEGRLEARDDIFFVTLEERTRLLAKESQDWKALVRSRRAERIRQEAITVPDTIRDWQDQRLALAAAPPAARRDIFQGTPISVGRATGPVRLIRSSADWVKVQPGDVLVTSVIDPGMAPLFGVVAALVAEMGGTLSHGAIMAREYGLPAIANVGPLLNQLENGEPLLVDAGLGEARRLRRAAGSPS